MEDILFQKIGVTIGQLAMDLLSRNVGDRIQSISEYQEKLGVARGTVQNGFKYLKENGAVELKNHGHMGSYIEKIDYAKLQGCCMKKEILGIMPLPYTVTYEGFATAVYDALYKLNFNMAYARGAVGRIRLVESGVYQFAVVSQYAAEYAMGEGRGIEVALNFGPGSFLSRHVLVLADQAQDGIRDGMKVACDSTSLDQSQITKNLIKGRQVKLVEIKTQNTLTALAAGIIDAGVWNYDDVIDNNRQDLHVVFLKEMEYPLSFSSAVIVVKREDEYMRALLRKYIHKEAVLRILKEVREGKRAADY